MISVVLCGRNDNYGGHLNERFSYSINGFLQVFDEVIYVDWNTDPGKKILTDEDYGPGYRPRSIPDNFVPVMPKSEMLYMLQHCEEKYKIDDSCRIKLVETSVCKILDQLQIKDFL